MDKGYFLPYQIRWLADSSNIKIWEKSRRIGATYVQSYEDARDCATGRVPSCWFSSADESAAREYIDYAERWARMFDAAARAMGEQVLDSDKDIKTFVIQYSNGVKQHALSSNPKAFRSKGGKVVLDEFAWHDNADTLWAAARPVITWGFPLRILSTHNGQSSLYNRFIERIKKGKLDWAHHLVDIYKAVEDGLVDKIMGRKTTDAEKADWIERQRADCADENTWLQEYCCVPVDETTAFLTYEMIRKVARDDLYRELDTIEGDLYVGVDIGRKKDLTVIWGIERTGPVKTTRFVRILERMPFSEQREILFSYLKHPKLRRGCIDATGIGMQLAEESQEAFGKYRIEAVTFTAKVKEEMAYQMRTDIEDAALLIPDEFEIREDFHSVRKVTTAAGNIRFDVAAAEGVSGHADRFWAAALANNAAADNTGPIHIATRGRSKIRRLVDSY